MVNHKNTTKKSGIKYDNDKLNLSLIPVVGLLLEADVYTRGKKKYGPHNWRDGIAWSRIYDALLRHILWHLAGEQFDPEDGQHHLASVIWGAKALMEYELTHPELDDRYIPFPPEQLRNYINSMKQMENKKK